MALTPELKVNKYTITSAIGTINIFFPLEQEKLLPALKI